MRETIKTHDAELYIGWPTTPDDIERNASVQVGVRYGVDSRWAVLTSPEQVADLRRQLQRASRAVWPEHRSNWRAGAPPFSVTGLVTPEPAAEPEPLDPALLEPDPGIVGITASYRT